MKFLLTVLSALTVGGGSSTLIANASINTKIQNNLKESNSNKNQTKTSDSSYNPTYPTVRENMNLSLSWSDTDHSSHHVAWSGLLTKQASFNWKKYAPSLDRLEQMYSSIHVNSLGSANVYTNHTDWGIENVSSGSSDFSMSKLITAKKPTSKNWTTFSGHNGSYNNTSCVTDLWDSDYAYSRGSSISQYGAAEANVGYALWVDGDYVNVGIYAQAYDDNSLSYVDAEIKHMGIEVSGISFVSKFSASSLANKVNQTMNQPFSFTSKTSSSLNSTITHSLIDNRNYTSNIDLIKNEFMKRLHSSLNPDFDSWNQILGNNPLDSQNIIINETDKTATMNIPDGQQKQFLSSITMPINMSYDIDGIKNTIRNWFSKPFVIDSDFSSNWSDNNSESESLSGGSSYISNKQKVIDEIHNRLKTHLGSDDYKTISDMISNISTSKDNNPNDVDITFKEPDNASTDWIESNQWINTVTMAVKVNLTAKYYANSAADRLSLQAGQIVDSTQPNDVLMNDHPSYDDSTKTYTYHTPMRLTFSSHTGYNEVLYVNNEPVPVVDNTYRIELTDNRIISNDNKTPPPTTYDVKLMGPKDPVNHPDGEITNILNFRVSIDSVSDNVNYKWLGWNPSSDPSKPTYYNQWLLTQKQIKDSQGRMIDNPKYNPLINITTGIISDQVWIKDNETNDNNHDYPFAEDPLDENGLMINKNNGSNYEKGYMAEAVVANSGVNNLTSNLENIDHIERVELDPKTMKEIGPHQIMSPQQLQMEQQFSDQGLWHYIIYQKNYVAKELDPKNNAFTITTPATSGSTIHKLLYISNSVADTGQDFLDIDDIKNNPNVIPFWSTYQANHLKSYLIAKGFDSDGIKTATYENNVAYWNQYVSDVAQGFNVPDPKYMFNLSNQIEPKVLKINETSTSKIKEDIINHVRDYMSIIGGSNFKYNSDYVITDSISNPKPLENVDLTKLLQDENTGKATGNLYIAALNTSTQMVGYKSFDVINSRYVITDQMLDLSTITLQQEEYNFSTISEISFENRWILQPIREALIANKPQNETRQYIYGEDYIISVDDRNDDFLSDKESESIINSFLKINGSKLTIKVSALEQSDKMTGSTTETFINNFKAPKPPIIKSDISNIFYNTNLGKIEDTNGNGYIDPQEIWNKLLEVNPNVSTDYPDLSIDQLTFLANNFSNPKSWYIRVHQPNDNFEGSINVTYESDFPPNPTYSKEDIGKLFTITDLGEVEDLNNDGKIDAHEIWMALLKMNGLINDKSLNENDFIIKAYADSFADGNYKFHGTVTANEKLNNLYTGTVDINFNGKAPLDPDIPEPDNKPNNPNNPDKHDEGTDSNDSSFNKKNLAWIIPLVIVLSAGLGIAGFFIIRRLKTKRKIK